MHANICSASLCTVHNGFTAGARVLVCVCVAGRFEAVVCSSVYFIGVLSLLATTPDGGGETRKGEVANSAGDTPPGVSLFP